MGDRALQDRADLVHGTMLGPGNFSQGPPIRRLVGKAQGLIQQIRRNTIGMRYVADTHPITNRLVTVRLPVDRPAEHMHGLECGESGGQQENRHDQPLLPAKFPQLADDL